MLLAIIRTIRPEWYVTDSSQFILAADGSSKALSKNTPQLKEITDT